MLIDHKKVVEIIDNNLEEIRSVSLSPDVIPMLIGSIEIAGNIKSELADLVLSEMEETLSTEYSGLRLHKPQDLLNTPMAKTDDENL